jgi:hypothetical protein
MLRSEREARRCLPDNGSSYVLPGLCCVVYVPNRCELLVLIMIPSQTKILVLDEGTLDLLLAMFLSDLRFSDKRSGLGD